MGSMPMGGMGMMPMTMPMGGMMGMMGMMPMMMAKMSCEMTGEGGMTCKIMLASGMSMEMFKTCCEMMMKMMGNSMPMVMSCGGMPMMMCMT